MGTKLAKDLVRGDLVETEDGRQVRIKSVTNGMIQGHVHIEYSGGWAEVARKDKVIAR